MPMIEKLMSVDEQEDALKQAIGQVASKSGSKVAKRLEKREKRESHEFRSFAHRLVDEMVDMYEDDDMAWEKLVDDTAKALKSIPQSEEE